MTGSAAFARDADVASTARERLDLAAAAMAVVEDAQRSALAALIELWPTSAWRVAGATSAKRWLLACTRCSEPEAHRLERLAGLCHRHRALADAVLPGQLSLSRADRLGAAATVGREPWLAGSLAPLLALNDRGVPDEDWSTVVRHWAELVDQERDIRPIRRHCLTMTQRLFGGGEIHADLSPSASPPPSTPGPTTPSPPPPPPPPRTRLDPHRRGRPLGRHRPPRHPLDRPPRAPDRTTAKTAS